MDRRRVIFGLILVLLGLSLLGRSLGWLDFTFREFIRTSFPVALILLGTWLIVRKRRHEEFLKAQAQMHGFTTRAAGAPSTPVSGEPPSGKSASAADSSPGVGTAGTGQVPRMTKYSKFLGDLFVDCNGVNLQNVEVSVGIGDTEIKLHGGRLAPGLNRLIVSGFVGDIRIFIPVGMPHYVHCSNFIGDVDAGGQKAGGFSNTIDSQSTDYETAEAKLYVAANNFVGDIKVFVV